MVHMVEGTRPGGGGKYQCVPLCVQSYAGVDFPFNDRRTINGPSTLIPITPTKDDQWEGLESFTVNITYEDAITKESHVLIRTIYIIDIDSK